MPFSIFTPFRYAQKHKKSGRNIAGGGFEFGSSLPLCFHRPMGFVRLESDMSPSGTPNCPTPLYKCKRGKGRYIKVVVGEKQKNKMQNDNYLKMTKIRRTIKTIRGE
jgi:hypothetical protein